MAGDPELRQVLQPRVEELVNRHKAHQRMMHERETLLRKHSAEFEAARQRSGEAHQLTPKAQVRSELGLLATRGTRAHNHQLGTVHV